MSDIVSCQVEECCSLQISLENHSEALRDANTALALDGKYKFNVKAVLAKAEALFAGGNFEMGQRKQFH